MTCNMCRDVVLEVRCPLCGRLPKDPQLAILTEAHDLLTEMSKRPKTGGISPEVYETLKVLTGVVTRLVKDTRSLRAPYGTRKGVPKHAPECAIHDPPHDHCDCVINRQPKVPRLQKLDWEKGEYACLNCGEVPVTQNHRCR